MPMPRPGRYPVLVAAVLAMVVAGCSTASTGGLTGLDGARSSDGPDQAAIRVVAAENVWGSLAAQLGGDRVSVRSIIDNPEADPHDYEPTVADARAMARARLVIVNGIGYDAWAGKLLDADPVPGRTVLTVGDLVGVTEGGNPHRWYSPADVRAVIDEITADYAKLDPAEAAYFAAQHTAVVGTDLTEYFGLLGTIKDRYAGTPVGASESMLAPLAQATGLDLLTPAGFLTAISEGTDPSPRDTATVDAQIRNHEIKVFVYNSQNATPDVRRQVGAARAAGIPVCTVTETLTPSGASFQDWQVRQLRELSQALTIATGT